MDELLRQSVPLAIAVFLATAMLSVGLDLTVRQVVEPLRRGRLVMISLATGLVLYALSAGTEGGPKFVQMVEGNTPFAFGLLAALLVVTVVFLPLVMNAAIPGVDVSIGEVVPKLLLLVALPIGVGMTLRARLCRLAERISPPIHRLSMLLLAAGLLGFQNGVHKKIFK